MVRPWEGPGSDTCPRGRTPADSGGRPARGTRAPAPAAAPGHRAAPRSAAAGPGAPWGRTQAGGDRSGADRPREAIRARRPVSGLRDAESAPLALLCRPLSRARRAPPATRVHRPRLPPPHTCRGMASRPRSSTRRCADAPPPRPGGGEGRGGGLAEQPPGRWGRGPRGGRGRSARGGRRRVCAGGRGRGGAEPRPPACTPSPSPPRGAGAPTGLGVCRPPAGPCRCGGAPFL